MTGRGHAIPLAALVTVRGHGCGRFSPRSDRSWRARRELREGMETVAVSQAPVVSETSAAVVPPVVGGTVAAFPPAVQDLARFFLSLARSSSQGAVVGAVSATVLAPGVGVLLCPSAPGGGAVTSCAVMSAPSLVARPSSASAAVPGLSGQQQREEELSRQSRRRRRSSSGGIVRANKR